MNNRSAQLANRILAFAPALLLLVVIITFGLQSSKFLQPQNFENILVQSASTAIVATGMTFVLLTAGVDLSVGAIMFVVAAVAGKIVLAGGSVPLALAATVGCGAAFGLFNSLFIAGFRLLPFVVTLATLYAGRGLALWITETRAMNLPESFLQIGAARWLGIPLPLWILAFVIAAAQLVLRRTPFGRQIYAVGHDLETARKAGINTRAVQIGVYVISGVCAALGAIVSLSQLGAVSPTFGNNREFTAIAAAVLGGASLFGGRGNVFPGTLLGAVLMQTVETGLNIVNADPYFYPLVTSAIIFVAVLLDTVRTRASKHATRRHIRPLAA